MVVGKDGKIVSRHVTIGINSNANAQVLSGLTVGEEVVIGEAEAESSEEQMRVTQMML